MKKFTISAIVAMGVVALSGAAFAGTTSANSRGLVSNASTFAADTVVPNDTIVPEQKDTTTQTEKLCLADTVVPTDTITPKKEGKDKSESTFADTVVPTDTVLPADTLKPKKTK